MVQKYLDLSTGHVSNDTALWLDSQPSSIIMYPKGEYGWFVYAASEEYDDDTPKDLIACIDHAKALDCTWIMFDADGELIEELPEYEW
jgi:hypothetical protein